MRFRNERARARARARARGENGGHTDKIGVRCGEEAGVWREATATTG